MHFCKIALHNGLRRRSTLASESRAADNDNAHQPFRCASDPVICADRGRLRCHSQKPAMPVQLLSWYATRIGCILFATLLALAPAGCGNRPGQRDIASEDSEGGETPDEEAAPSRPAKDQKSAAKKKRPRPGKKIGGIPIDVWPEVWLKDPLAVAAEKGPAAGAAPATTGDSDPAVAKTGTDGPPAERPDAASGAATKPGGADWTALIS